MRFFQNPNPRNLDQWLQIATTELVVPAERRIWAEVTSHYEEAVEGHLQEGLPIALAQHAALAELGDAKAAGRRFRTSHLTEAEVRKVAVLLKSYQPSLEVHIWGLTGCCSLGSVLPKFLSPISSLVCMVVVMIVYETVVFVLARGKSPRSLVLMSMGVWLMLMGLWLMSGMPFVFWSHTAGLMRCAALGYLLNSGIALRQVGYYFRLSNKLGKAGEDWMGTPFAARNEIPPDKPVAS